MSLEISRTIKGHENYMATTWGRIISKKTGEAITPEVHTKGYLRVYLYDKGKRKHYKVHRLVAETFIPNPEGKPHVNHIDGNNQNNSVSNLEWVTDAENKEKAKALRVLIGEE